MSAGLSSTAYEELLAYSTDILTVLDENGVIRYESPSITRQLGYDSVDLLGETVFDYIHPDDQKAALTTFEEVFVDETTATGTVDLRFRHADGSWEWLESRGIDETTSEIGGYVVASRDIGARKQRELQLEQFASVVSHDLRNPLTVARGHLDLLRDECESERLDKIDTAHERMDTLIEELLTLARQGNTIGDTELIDLGTFVGECWKTVDTGEATLEIETAQRIRTDRSRLKQLVENLIRNAIEHGGEEVTVTVGDLDDGYFVEDDGTGIPEADRDDVFTPGYTTGANGTGFGLSIVKEVANAHGWSARATGGTNGGARFEFTDTGSEH